jgi:ComF family protein
VLNRLLSLLAPALCTACGAGAAGGSPLCRRCLAALRVGDGRLLQFGSLQCWAAAEYDGPAGALVRALKFGGRVGVAQAMAAQIAANAPPALLRGALVPVPPDPVRRRRRGIDHSGELAAALSRRAGLVALPCLTRDGDHGRQVGRSRAERLRGPSVRVVTAVPPSLVLVDDVVTTGATLQACARALRAAGATEIHAVAYAITIGR